MKKIDYNASIIPAPMQHEDNEEWTLILTPDGSSPQCTLPQYYSHNICNFKNAKEKTASLR